MRKTLSVNALLERVRSCFGEIADHRGRRGEYELVDVLMSGLAVFAFKDASLLAFDHQRDEPVRRHNLKTLFGVERAPCDSQLREVLDGVDPSSLRPAFKAIHQEMQRQGELEAYRFLGKYLVSVDGTGLFSSGKVSCSECCCKTHRNGQTSYYHQLLAAVIVHPDQPTVLPFFPEAITRPDGSEKNDCEHNASKRLIPALRETFPKLDLIVLQDALACNGPHIKMLKAQGFEFIITAKPASDSLLLKMVVAGLATGRTVEWEEPDGKGGIRGYRVANGVPLNHEHKDLLVNFVDYWEVRADGSEFNIAFVTSLPLTADQVGDVVRAGRSRWKVENETFNTLKNLGYNLQHSYGHGQKHLSTVFGMLMFLMFLIDQVQEACCRYFQAARNRCHSRKGLWERMRAWFDLYRLENWEALFGAIIWGHPGEQLGPVRCRSG